MFSAPRPAIIKYVFRSTLWVNGLWKCNFLLNFVRRDNAAIQ